MARTLQFTNLTLFTATDILLGDGLVYTPLGLNVTARKYDSDGNATGEYADTDALLIGYNTTTVPPLDPLNLLGAVDISILLKSGDSGSDTIRATSGNDLVYWDYATLFSLATLSVPIDVAVLTRYNLPSSSQESAIEVFDLGDGNDILSLVHSNQQFLVSGLLTDPQAYAFAATAFGGGGNDVLWGSVNGDVFHGDEGADRIDTGGGADTAYGGAGLDTIEGAGGNDLLIDTADGAVFHGGAGDDVIVMQAATAGLTLGASTADDGLSAGNDGVYYSGSYASSSMALGGGDDVFISSATAGNAADRVTGGPGMDIVSAGIGADDIDGGDDGDALWGGAGGDTIFGGPGSDFLYGGEGDSDQLFGGAGGDYYYWARIDGKDDQIHDEMRAHDEPGQAENLLTVFAGYDASGALPAGAGVFETDGTITDNDGSDDMVYAYDIDGPERPGTLWRLEVMQGEGAGHYVDFDQRDIDAIVLWNHDAVDGTPGLTRYEWDGATYSAV